MVGVVERRAVRHDDVLVVQQLLDDFRRPRRSGDDGLRRITETQAEQRLIERFGIAPGRQFVAPKFHMLLAAQPVGLLGRKQLRGRAVGPGEARRGVRVMGALLIEAASQQAGLPQHHHVARVVGGGADEIDDGIGLHPFAHGLGAGARLAGAAPGEDQPIDPIAARRQLVGPRPETPVAQQFFAEPPG